MKQHALPILPDSAPGVAAVGIERVGATVWDAVAAAFPDVALFIVDADQVVRAFSPGAERLLGFRAEDVVGAHCRKSNRCQTCIVGCGLRERRIIDDVPLTLYRDDGSTVRVRKTARAFPSADGSFGGGVEILVPDTSPAAKPSAHPLGFVVDDAPLERGGLITRDPAMKELLRRTENVARTDATVLVRGESGTGKELLARLVHDQSPRQRHPFLAINCAAVSSTLLESELFGHERGAFTGAIEQHHGYFERADGGTLFLDEVAELPQDVQAKLLRVLETGTFFRLGGKKAVSVDVRVVSATHTSLRAAAAAKRFREDLLYRLRVVPLFLPPLRERRVDIPVLVDHFVARLNVRSAERGRRVVERVAPDAMRALYAWPFPGNVRELKNCIEYAFAVGAGGVLARADLPPELFGQSGAAHLPADKFFAERSESELGHRTLGKELLAPSAKAATTPSVGRGRRKRETSAKDREEIEDALRRSGGDVGAAAARLGMSRATFWRRRRALVADGLDRT